MFSESSPCPPPPASYPCTWWVDLSMPSFDRILEVGDCSPNVYFMSSTMF